MTDIVTTGDGFAGTGIEPFMRFDMIIGEGEDAEPTMKGGRIMNDGAKQHIDAEAGGANIGGIDIGKKEAFGRFIGSEAAGFEVDNILGIEPDRVLGINGGGSNIGIQ